MDADALDVLRGEVGLERDTQLRHFEALDTRSGIVLGFSAVLVALGGGPEVLVRSVARFLAVAAAIGALIAFFPRGFPVLDLETVRRRYGDSREEFLRLHLLDVRIEMLRGGSLVLHRRAKRLLVSGLFLGAAVSALGAEALVAWVTG